MTVLLVVPDYASHWYPLSAVAETLRARGHRVVVATGQTLAPLIAADGHEHVELTLGSGSNGGVRPADADAEMDAFFAATREGMIATLRYQAERRRHDLLWEPQAVAEHLRRIVETIAPDTVLVDQLAFGATAALRGLRVPFLSFLPGHPCQLPAQRRDLRLSRAPAAGLRAIRHGAPIAEIAVHRRHVGVHRGLQRRHRRPRSDGDAARRRVRCRWDPRNARQLPLADRRARRSPPRRPVRRFLHPVGGTRPCLRTSRPRAAESDHERTSRSEASSPRGRTSCSGSPTALQMLGWDAVVATGVNDPQALGTMPAGWIVREHLPQVAALDACDIVVCHGGNNTVTEALTAGLPVLAAPFSTDQFAGAEDLRRAGLGDAIDPRGHPGGQIAAVSLLDARLAQRLGGRPRSEPSSAALPAPARGGRRRGRCRHPALSPPERSAAMRPGRRHVPSRAPRRATASCRRSAAAEPGSGRSRARRRRRRR